jgi:hypothetical protein
MSRVSDTGESLRAATKRSDDWTWTRVEPLLRQGAELWRPSRLRNYFTRFPNDPHREGNGVGWLSPGRIRKLEAAGVLMRVGVDAYALKGDRT